MYIITICVILVIIHSVFSAEGDYESGAPGYQATFTPSTAMPGSSTVEVPTNDDNIFEETERFFANIVVLPDSDKQVSEGNPSMAAVDILDNTSRFIITLKTFFMNRYIDDDICTPFTLMNSILMSLYAHIYNYSILCIIIHWFLLFSCSCLL